MLYENRQDKRKFPFKFKQFQQGPRPWSLLQAFPTSHQHLQSSLHEPANCTKDIRITSSLHNSIHSDPKLQLLEELKQFNISKRTMRRAPTVGGYIYKNLKILAAHINDT